MRGVRTRYHAARCARPGPGLYGVWMGSDPAVRGLDGVWMGSGWGLDGVWMGPDPAVRGLQTRAPSVLAPYQLAILRGAGPRADC